MSVNSDGCIIGSQWPVNATGRRIRSKTCRPIRCSMMPLHAGCVYEGHAPRSCSPPRPLPKTEDRYLFHRRAAAWCRRAWQQQQPEQKAYKNVRIAQQCRLYIAHQFQWRRWRVTPISAADASSCSKRNKIYTCAWTWYSHFLSAQNQRNR